MFLVAGRPTTPLTVPLTVPLAVCLPICSGAAATAAGDTGDSEYLVHFPTLCQMAKDCGLSLVAHKGLHDFFAATLQDKAALGRARLGSSSPLPMWRRWLKEMGVVSGSVREPHCTVRRRLSLPPLLSLTHAVARALYLPLYLPHGTVGGRLE